MGYFQNLDPYDPRRRDMRVDFDAPAAGFGQMPYGAEDEEYLPPAPPMQQAPAMPPPRPATALDRLQEINANRPTTADPAYRPKPLERVLGAVAGAGLGFAEGYLNSGRRGPVVRPGTGAMVADAITNRKFNRANREWEQQMEQAKGAAEIEGQVEKNKRDQERNAAQIAASNAQQRAAEAREARYNRPDPLEAPKETEAEAFTRRKTEAEELGLKPGTTVYQHYVGTGKFPYEPPQAAPKPSVAEVNKERETEADRLGLKGDDRLFYIANGKVPSRKAPSTGGVSGANRADRKAVEAKANELLQQHGGNYDAAIAAATDLAVKDRLTASKNAARVASGSGRGGGRTITIGGKPITINTPGGGAPPAASQKKDPLGIR